MIVHQTVDKDGDLVGNSVFVERLDDPFSVPVFKKQILAVDATKDHMIVTILAALSCFSWHLVPPY